MRGFCCEVRNGSDQIGPRVNKYISDNFRHDIVSADASGLAFLVSLSYVGIMHSFAPTLPQLVHPIFPQYFHSAWTSRNLADVVPAIFSLISGGFRFGVVGFDS